MSHRQHGTRVKYVIDKCRCDACREASRIAEKKRRRERLYGIEAYVDAEPARQHVRDLGRQGMGWKRVAKAAGLSPSTVWKLMYGDDKRGRAPNKRIRPGTAEAILSVELDLAPGAKVPSNGTRRRLQALVALGYSQSRLAAELDMMPANFGRTLHHNSEVRKTTADAVVALYDRLSMAPPVGTDHRSKISVTRAKNYAAHMMWLPPLAWDDEDIDDPFAVPVGIGVESRRDLVEDFDWLVEQGESPTHAAARLGVTVSAIDKVRGRAA